MDRFLSIPRDALAALLRASGSPLSPEAYLASLSEVQFKKFASRATVALWSKYLLLVAAILSVLWTCTPFGFCFESVVVTLVLGVITFFEFRAHHAFRDKDPAAPTIGFRNQLGFAIFIFLYGCYHALVPVQIPANYREEMTPDLAPLIHSVVVATYVTIAIVGGISQFCLAWYYRSARGNS